MLASVFANVHCLFYSRCMDNCIMCHCALTFSMHVRYVVVTTMLFGFVCFFSSVPIPLRVCVCVCVVSWRCCCRSTSFYFQKSLERNFPHFRFMSSQNFHFYSVSGCVRFYLNHSFGAIVVLWHCKRRCEIENKM